MGIEQAVVELSDTGNSGVGGETWVHGLEWWGGEGGGGLVVVG